MATHPTSASNNRHSRTHLEVKVEVVPGETPTPAAAPPQPHPMAVLKVLQNSYDVWIAAGGTPPIYGNV